MQQLSVFYYYSERLECLFLDAKEFFFFFPGKMTINICIQKRCLMQFLTLAIYDRLNKKFTSNLPIYYK